MKENHRSVVWIDNIEANRENLNFGGIYLTLRKTTAMFTAVTVPLVLSHLLTFYFSEKYITNLS